MLVRIVDLGLGVDADDREGLFEPFERGAAGGARPGAGLGLAIARGFAHANDSSVWAEPAHPEEPASSSRFRLQPKLGSRA